ncbi:unnamed protein product [Diamesa serratosioi]
MKIPTVEKFLFCLELKYAGIVCAWMGMIGSALFAIAIVLSVVFGLLPGMGGSITEVIVIGIFMLIATALYFFFSKKLLQATKDRNHHQMKPYLILAAIGTIISALGILALSLSYLIEAIFNGYCFICIYSLYKEIESEIFEGDIAYAYATPKPKIKAYISYWIDGLRADSVSSQRQRARKS